MLSEGDVRKDVKTLLASNLSPPPELAAHSNVTCHNALTSNPSPSLKEEGEYSIAAPNNQAKLMHWHYRLEHVPLSKLKRLETNGKIP